MIRLHIDRNETEIEMHDSDELILRELSSATIKMLQAMEHCNGNPAKENLTVLIMMLINETEQE